MRRLTLLVILLVAAPAHGQVVIQGEQELDFDRTESWAMKYFASVTLLSGFGPPRDFEPGTIEFGLETAWVPSLSEVERTVGFNGTKTEDLNKTPFFARPRMEIGLPHRWSLQLSYLPPVEVFDVKPNLLAAAIGRPLYRSELWAAGMRVSGQYGSIEGDFTCSEEDAAAGSDLQRNPFGCEVPSEDEYTIRTASLGLDFSRRPSVSSPFEPYLALVVTYMDLDFQVNARYSGLADRTLLLTHGFTASLAAGLRYQATHRVAAHLELFYTPLEVIRPPDTSRQTDELVNLRALLAYGIR